MISTQAVNEGGGIRSPVPFSTAGMAGPAGDLVPYCGSGTGPECEWIWVRESVSTHTYGTVKDMDVLRKIMGVAHMLGCSVPPVGRDRTARDGAEQFAFTDGEGHLGACELERNRSEMVMPGM